MGGEVCEFSVGIAMSLRIEALGSFGDGGGKNELAFELAFELSHVFLFSYGGEDGFGGDGAVGAGSPGFGIGDEGKRARGNDLGGEALVGPASAEGAPRLEMNISELPFFHFGGGPVGGGLDVGGIGETWAVDVGQVAFDFHDLGMSEAFLFDLVDGGQIGLGGSLSGQRQDGKHQKQGYL